MGESYPFPVCASPLVITSETAWRLPAPGIFSRLFQAILEQIMEEKTSTPLSGDALERKIEGLLQEMRSADPAELENIKSLIRKKVRFFDRMSLAALLLKNATDGRRDHEKTARKQMKAERPERKAPEQTAKSQEAKEARPERIVPEGAKTLYLNIGKMKHLYAKDLSKLLQTELGITRDDIYQIRVHDKYSFVTMSEENCAKAIEKLNNQAINGRTAKVTYSEK